MNNDRQENPQWFTRKVMAYLYRHIRTDKNIPFYVGIGSDSNGDYKRAFDKHRRSQKWLNIIVKTKYSVQIILDDLTLDEAKQKEIEFIELYGRSDKNQGGLCNLTDGGEGNPGRIVTDEWRKKKSIEQRGKICSDEFKQKRREYMTGRKMPRESVEKQRQWLKDNHPMRGKKMSEQAKQNISNGHKGIAKGENNPNWGKFGSDSHKAKKVICTKTNQVWGSAKEMAFEVGYNYGTIVKKLNGQRKNNTTYIYIN